ncbi:hypothetical protein L7F22_006392 [Adiantum nelumboides]|nr:hypothetical protein [Adiantum nelumboides]
MQEISSSSWKSSHEENYGSFVRWHLPHSSSNRLWMKHQRQFYLQSSGCVHVTWVDRSLQHWRNLIRKPLKKWLNCRREQQRFIHIERVQAVLSVTRLSAALATVAAATAVSTTDKQDSRTGLAVATAAALVAAHFADFAKQIGANQQSVLASVSAGQCIKHPTDVLGLTTSAAASLQATRNALKGRKWACIQALMTMSNRQMRPFSASNLSSNGSHAEFLFYSEILARGAYFFVRVLADKVHKRFVSVCLDDSKEVILKITSRHLAGVLIKVEKRIVFQLLDKPSSWRGRSLLYNEVERSYFGLFTSEGIIEFECLSKYDHQIWTQGIFALLNFNQQENPINCIM